MLPETILFAGINGNVRVTREEIPELLKELRADRDIVRRFIEGGSLIRDFKLSESAKLFFGDSIDMYRIPILLNDIERLISGIEDKKGGDVGGRLRVEPEVEPCYVCGSEMEIYKYGYCSCKNDRCLISFIARPITFHNALARLIDKMGYWRSFGPRQCIDERVYQCNKAYDEFQYECAKVKGESK